jgi:caspase domain-containing protein
MARFLLSALSVIALVFSAEITRTPALGSQLQTLIQPEQNPQTRQSEKRSESGQRTAAIQEKRVALIIGNGAYVGANPLRNPPNDARAMSAALREIGFEVVERIDLNSREMKRAVIEFGNKLQTNDVGLFYYAGHGVQSNGKNYLIPVDAEIEKEADIVVDGVELDTVMGQIEGAKNRLNIVILDACRNDFSTRGWRSQGRGLAQVANAPSGIFIAYATAPGSAASDNKSGQNGLYTQELLKSIRQPGMRIEEVFKQVRLRVKELSEGRQIPWESSSLEGEFYFIPPNSTVATSNLPSMAGGRPDNSPTASAPNAETLKNRHNNAVNPDPNSAPPPINSGRSRDSIQKKLDTGLYDDAIQEALDYLENQPNDAQVNWLIGLGYIKKGLFPGGFRHISKAVEGGMPVMFTIAESSFLSVKQGTLKVQKEGLEIQLDKTTSKIPFNLVREISAASNSDLITRLHLKVGVNQNNKIREKVFKLQMLFFHNYSLTADDMAKLNSGTYDAWVMSIANFITDIKTKVR